MEGLGTRLAAHRSVRFRPEQATPGVPLRGRGRGAVHQVGLVFYKEIHIKYKRTKNKYMVIQIKYKGTQIKYRGIQIKYKDQQIKYNGLQIKNRGTQLRTTEYKLNTRENQLKLFCVRNV